MSTGQSQQREIGPRAILVLISLADGDKHGYAVMQDVHDFAGVPLGPGTLYGALEKLESEGLVQQLQARGRTQPYALTDRGRLVLMKHLDDYERIVKTARERI
jgi:DNA-binding PadR family transcriptional regulator